MSLLCLKSFPGERPKFLARLHNLALPQRGPPPSPGSFYTAHPHYQHAATAFLECPCLFLLQGLSMLTQLPSLFVCLTPSFSGGLNLVQLIIKMPVILHPPHLYLLPCDCSSLHQGAEFLFPPTESELVLDLPCRRKLVPFKPEPRQGLQASAYSLGTHHLHENKPGLAS